MRRSVWVGLLLVIVGCFADPPVVGETTAANSSNGATSDGATTASTDSPSTTEPGMTSSVMTSSVDVTGSVDATSIEPGTSAGPATGDTFGETTSTPMTSGAPGICSCQFDAGSTRAMGGAYECIDEGVGFAPKPVDDPCPKDFFPGSPCMAYNVGVQGCCDPMGNVLWCPDMEAGTGAQVIDCTLECGG